MHLHKNDERKQKLRPTAATKIQDQYKPENGPPARPGPTYQYQRTVNCRQIAHQAQDKVGSRLDVPVSIQNGMDKHKALLLC